MKIQNEQIQALQQQGEARRKSKEVEGKSGFDALFAGQLDSSQAGGGQGLLAGTLPLLLNESAALTGLETEGREESSNENSSDMTAVRISGLLDSMENYSKLLGRNGNQDLKSVYGLLTGMTDEIKSIRASLPATPDNDLNSLLTELETITVTERFKFNRGDYLA